MKVLYSVLPCCLQSVADCCWRPRGGWLCSGPLLCPVSRCCLVTLFESLCPLLRHSYLIAHSRDHWDPLTSALSASPAASPSVGHAPPAALSPHEKTKEVGQTALALARSSLHGLLPRSHPTSGSFRDMVGDRLPHPVRVQVAIQLLLLCDASSGYRHHSWLYQHAEHSLPTSSDPKYSLIIHHESHHSLLYHYWISGSYHPDFISLVLLHWIQYCIHFAFRTQQLYFLSTFAIHAIESIHLLFLLVWPTLNYESSKWVLFYDVCLHWTDCLYYTYLCTNDSVFSLSISWLPQVQSSSVRLDTWS